MSSTQSARVVLDRHGHNRVVVDGRMLELSFSTLIEAQDFADLCNKKTQSLDRSSGSKLITTTINGTIKTMTQHQWSRFLAGLE